jgi:acyl-CoA synthetase (AMP-forming)/AMP-acid ligase II
LYRGQVDPDRVAYADWESQLTFGELAERATGRARALQQQGIGPGDHVALVMTAGLRWGEMFWALQLLGAVPCAFNPFVPSETLARRVGLTRPRLVITDETAADMRPVSGPLIAPDIEPEDLAYLQLTSGTSGSPRAAMIRHRNVLSFLREGDEAGQIAPSDVLVSWVPPWHDLGLVRFMLTPVYYGVPCHIIDPAITTIPQWLATISGARGTMTGAPDFAFRLAVRMVDPAIVDLSSLRYVINGAEPVRWASIDEFETRFRVPGTVMPGYGLAEATLAVAAHFPGEQIVVDARGNVYNGRPMPGNEVRAGENVESPEEILVRSEAVFAGYFDAPEDTNRTLQDGWLHTGDSGYLDSEGRLYVLGRRSGMIKRAGAVISPRELEEAAQQAEGVRVAAATVLPTSSDGDELITVVVEADVSEARPRDEIAAEVSRKIVASVGFAPGCVSVVPRRTIPRTENGKIRHERLRGALIEGVIG